MVTEFYVCDIALPGEIRLTATELKLAGVNVRNAKTGGDQFSLFKDNQVLKFHKDFAACSSRGFSRFWYRLENLLKMH